MPKCGNCGDQNATVAMIRECYASRYGVQREDVGLAFDTDESVPVTMSAGTAIKLTGSLLGSTAAIDASHSAQPEPVEITEGFWKLGDDFYKVQRSQTSGYLYAKSLGDADGITTWDYESGGIAKLRNGGATPLTEADATAFGKLYGVCLLCGRTLTNEESIARGIGPICAGKQGW